jgi:hypothetical protein
MLWLASYLLKSQHLLPPKSLRPSKLIHQKLNENSFGFPAITAAGKMYVQCPPFNTVSMLVVFTFSTSKQENEY